jgi:hypothetical protein
MRELKEKREKKERERKASFCFIKKKKHEKDQMKSAYILSNV